MQFRRPLLERNVAFPSNNKRLRMFPICRAGLFYRLIAGMFSRLSCFCPLPYRRFVLWWQPPPRDVDGPSRFSVHLAAANCPLQLLMSSRCGAAAAGMRALTAEVNECSFVVGALVCRRRGAREATEVESARLFSSAWSLGEANKLPS